MAAGATEARSDYFVHALAVVGGAGLLHFGLAHVLLTLIVEVGSPGVPHGREVVSLAVLATVLGQLAALYLRTQYGDPADVARAVPQALRSIAPVATVLFGLLVLPPAVPPPVTDALPLHLAVALAPGVAATWAAAIIVAIPAARVLHAFAIRAPGGRAPRSGGVPPPLEHTYSRILSAASLATALVVLGAITHRLEAAEHLDASMLLPVVGLLAFPLLAAISGASLGSSLGQDILSVARRLDAAEAVEEIGSVESGVTITRAQATSMAVTDTPLVVTRRDEVGELVANLEALRARLDKDLHRYESVLEQAQTAERIKADFLHAVSHELRTPLNVIGGFAQLLLEGAPTPLTDAQAEDVRLIAAGGKQLLELINDILDISMIESGDLRLYFSRTDLGALVRETVDFHQPQLRDKPVRLRGAIAPDLPPVICDRRRIGQILTNLVSNAIKFTEEGEIVVQVSFDTRAETVMLRCIDTGIGIDADELDMIFEEYRQVGSAKRRKKGTGLGLAIARSIAEHHGGSLTADSVVGEGSTFTLALPLDPPGRPASIDMAEEAARAVVRRTFRPGELQAMEAGS